MASFGETLKRERESRNISLREIAETTKINIRHLEALEADRFDSLPGGVFNRGFVRAYADYLGIDADTAVRDFLEAMSASGVETNEGALPSPDRVAPRARTIDKRTVVDPEPDEGALNPRISMGPDPRAMAAGNEGARAPGRRRFRFVAFWVIVGGALLAGLLFMRSDRSPSPPAERAVEFDSPRAAEPGEAQEAFDPPEGMFVDAGPAAAEEGEVAPSEPASQPPPRPEEPSARAPSRQKQAEPTVAGIATAPPRKKANPPVARTQKTEAPPPEPARTEKRPEPERTSQPPPAIATPRRSEPAPPPPGPLSLEVEVTRETWLWLSCDSDARIDRRVRPGETSAMQCLRSIRVSAHDAGAIRLRVNGAACMPLGDDGARVYGYTIRFDDAHLICRSSTNR
jgi:transcriptional regulator with XRE-family HTH domain